VRSSVNYIFIASVLLLFFFSIPISSGFSSNDFLADYKSFISSYLSFFKQFGPTGRAVNGGGYSPALLPSPGAVSGSNAPGLLPSLPPCDPAGTCDIGYYCREGFCYRYTCLIDADCPPNLVCRNQACDLPPCTSDRDHDGICDDTDNCPNRYNFDQSDIDEDGVGDVCDNCRYVPNPDQHDSHRPSNGRGDACDPIQDTDRDGVRDEDDNCPTVVNPNQEDADLDGIGDDCDPCPLIAGPCNTQCTFATDSCTPECPELPNEVADSDSDGYAWVGCFAQQTTCNSMVQCCEDIDYTCGDCDDVDDIIGRNSYPGADELCDGADNDCNGVIDEGCGIDDDEGETDDDGDYLLVRNRSPRSAMAREAMLIENLDMVALQKQLVTLQEDLALTQATLKAILAYFYTTASTSDITQQMMQLQNELELLLAQGRSLLAKIDANEPKELILEDAQHHARDIEQMNLALKDTLTRL